MRRIFSAGVCLATVLTGAASAAERGPRWTEVRSAHFTVYADGGVKQAREVADQFEAIRDLFHRLWPWARVDPGLPIVILAARDEAGLKALLPEFWERKGSVRPGGIFVRSPERHYIALRTDLKDVFAAWEENPYQVVYHEYAHLILDLNFGRLPAWVNEGLAEFYGSTMIGRDEMNQGKPLRSHIFLLRERPHLSLETLLKVDYRSPEYNEQTRASVFYAQSWALVHYFLLGDKGAHAQAFADYVNLLRKDVPEDQAAAQALGDLGQLGRTVDAYVRRFSFTYMRARVARAAAGPELPTREVGEAEAQALRGDFHLARGRPEIARPVLERAIEQAPDLAAAHASLAFLEMREEKREEARRRVSRAVELDSTSFLVHYLHAILNMESGQTGESLAGVEESLHRCVRLNRDFAPGYALLAEVTASRSGDYEGALRLARRAVNLEPGVVGHRLTVGRLLVGMGKFDEAGAEGRRAVAAARSEGDRQIAQSFLDSLPRAGTPTGPALSARPAGSEAPAGQPPERPTSEGIRIADGGARPDSRTVFVKGVITMMNCLPSGELTFAVKTPAGTLTLRADAPDRVFLKKGEKFMQMDWNCGALEIPVTVHYEPRPPAQSGSAFDGTVVWFYLEDAAPAR